MQIIKLFSKSSDVPSGLISSSFKTRNGNKIKLQLSDTHLYRLKQSQKGVKTVQLQGLRYQIKQVQTTYHLVLETDETPKPIEYIFIDQPGMWDVLLKQKLPLMEYQKYYEMEKLIGSGSFASVYRGKSKIDGSFVAIKAFLKKMLIQKDPKNWRVQIVNEIKIMRYLNHPNILKLLDVFENKAQIYLMTELCRGGNLAQSLKKLEEPLPLLTVKAIFRPIVDAVKYMHDLGIMHRDIKPGNILFRKPISLKQFGLSAQDGPILTDFGISSHVQKQLNVYQFGGSYGYMAPEIFECEEDSTKFYNEKCDIFSLGCLLYELITTKPLFQGNNIKQQNREFQVNPFKIMDDCFNNKQMCNLLCKMLSPLPEERPNCEEILNNKALYLEYDEAGCPLFKDYKKPTILSIQKPKLQFISKSSSTLPQTSRVTSRRHETQTLKRSSFQLPPIKRLPTELHH